MGEERSAGQELHIRHCYQGVETESLHAWPHIGTDAEQTRSSI